MSRFRDVGDFFFNVSADKYGAFDKVHKFGRNDTVSSTAWQDVWSRGGEHNWWASSSGFTLRITSNSTDDRATGTGVRSVTVEGLDTDWVAVSETLVPSSSGTLGTQTFMRVNRAYVASMGEYATLLSTGSTGTITINTSSSDAVAEIETFSTSAIQLGQSNVARYSVPANYSAYVTHIEVQSPSTIDGNTVMMFQRQGADTLAAPFTPKRLVWAIDNVQGNVDRDYHVPLGPFPEKTDIWFAALGGSNTARTVNVSFDIIIAPSIY